MPVSRLVAVVGAITLLSLSFMPLHAQQLEKRIALVIGESAYASGDLPTAANDAGLVAQTLKAAGFDVVGARDLETQALRDALHEFVEKARSSGPDTVAMIYFAGYGLQSGGENFIAGVDARIDTAADIPTNAIRVSDFVKRLAGLQIKARIVVLDAARKNPFAESGQPLAGGLALMQPNEGALIAFNAAPGMIGPDEQGPYGAYAKALAEMIKAGDAPANGLFERVRARVEEASKGAEVPWNASRISAPFDFFTHTAEVPADRRDRFSELMSKPIASFGGQDAYLAAVARDTIDGYEEFLAAYPDDQLAKRVRAIVAARRESIVWRETCSDGEPRAYWSYLKRYPFGPHAYEARRTLSHLAVAVDPPPSFEELVYDVPPPPPEEIFYISQPVVYLDDPAWAFAPRPPLPANPAVNNVTVTDGAGQTAPTWPPNAPSLSAGALHPASAAAAAAPPAPVAALPGRQPAAQAPAQALPNAPDAAGPAARPPPQFAKPEALSLPDAPHSPRIQRPARSKPNLFRVPAEHRAPHFAASRPAAHHFIPHRRGPPFQPRHSTPRRHTAPNVAIIGGAHAPASHLAPPPRPGPTRGGGGGKPPQLSLP